LPGHAIVAFANRWCEVSNSCQLRLDKSGERTSFLPRFLNVFYMYPTFGEK
jgi:hypothetical protein